MKKIITGKKRIITRIILIISIIIFGILWKPEKYSTQIIQYIVLGNIFLVFVLMELLPLRFRYQYRTIIKFLQHFNEVYDQNLSYSYTPVIVIKSNLHKKIEPTHLINIEYKSDKTLFSLSHENKIYDFVTDTTDKNKVLDLVSVIIYYLQKDIPYEILYEHSKRISHTL